MDAWERYKQRQRNQAVKDITMENCDAYIEHMDLIILHILHTEEGYGAKRLSRVFRKIYKRFNEFKWYMKDDRTKFNDGVERMDTFALKYKLREIGFDYDEEVRLAMQEVENED